MASAFLDVCRFNPTLGGTTDWTYSSAVTGYQSPTAAGAANGATYSYRAESNDLSQWEVGFGTYNSGTGVFARTTVLFNSSGTTSKINFSTVPQVAIVALGEDLASLVGANSFAGAQTVSNATDATSSSAGGAFTIAGGLAIAKKLFVGLAAAFAGAVSITDSTASTSTTTGALKVTGGVGVVGQVSAANLALATTTASQVNVDTSASSQLSSGSALIQVIQLTPAGLYFFVIVSEMALDGSTAIYLCGNTSVTLVSSTGSLWVAPTTTPAAGKLSVAHNGTRLNIYNNYNIGAAFHAVTFKNV